MVNKMKKINKKIIPGTKLKLDSSNIWYTVKEIICGIWLKVEGLEGSFQSSHIIKFTNK